MRVCKRSMRDSFGVLYGLYHVFSGPIRVLPGGSGYI